MDEGIAMPLFLRAACRPIGLNQLWMVTAIVLAFGTVPARAQEPKKPAANVADASDPFFQQGIIPQLRVTIAEPELEKLRNDNRAYVKCTVQENDKVTYQNVAIKLKGAAGSFRELDDRPALTLNVSKFEKGKSFHGLNKFHLNNSVQDETYLHEWLCEELCRTAGLPATRVTHARVWLNGRDVGLYVLKEGFDKTFLQRHFKDSDGNLYDGGFLQDIDAELEKDAGKGPDDRSDLQALLAACQESDIERRWQRVSALLDIDQFLTFMAIETMTGHWDGYTLCRNNFRLYFHPLNKKAYFLPHGMDQMFGDPGASILDFPEPIVSSTVMRNPEWRRQYRQRIARLLPLFDPVDRLLKRVDVGHKRLRPIIAAMDPQLGVDFDDRINDLKQRLTSRAESLREQNGQPDPQPLEFDDQGRVQLADWFPVSECEDGVLEVPETVDDKPKVLTIQCGPSQQCVASWRCKVMLGQGRYVLHARVRTENVTGLDDEKGNGAGIRISGGTRTNKLEATTPWTDVQFEFDVEEQIRDVVMVAELRASRGQVWFDVNAFQLSRRASD